MKKAKKSIDIVHGLLDYLTEVGENHLLPEVSLELQKIVEISKKAEKVEVVSTVAFSLAQQNLLKQTLSNILHNNIPIVYKIDKKLIGGFSIKIADWFLDATILYQLKQIKKNLLN